MLALKRYMHCSFLIQFTVCFPFLFVEDTHFVFVIKAISILKHESFMHLFPVNIFDLSRWREHKPRDSLMIQMHHLLSVSFDRTSHNAMLSQLTYSRRNKLQGMCWIPLRLWLRNLWFTVRYCNEGLLCKCWANMPGLRALFFHETESF